MTDGCQQDTGSADRLRCLECEPPERVKPAERRLRARDAKAAKKESERGPYNAREFWGNVREARGDTGERSPDE